MPKRDSAVPPAGRGASTSNRNRRGGRPLPPRSDRPWWQAPWVPAAGAAVLIAVIVVVYIAFTPAKQTSSTPSGSSVPSNILNAVTKPSESVLSTVGTGGQQSSLTRLRGEILKDSSGKAIVVYVGAEYCPYCASERWAEVMALSRFGSFSGLTMTTSSRLDAYPDTPTFSFHGSSYTSQWVTFEPTEMQDRLGNSLETMSAQVSQIFNNIDQPPYTGQKGGFPFAYIGGQFVLSGTGVPPQVLQGMSAKQIAASLSDPNSPVTQAIVGHANYLTAAICLSTGDQPGAVCSSPTIKGIESQLSAQSQP